MSISSTHIIPVLSIVVYMIIIGSILHPSTALAQPEYTPLQQLPGAAGESTDLQTYLQALFEISIGIASILSVLMIIIGGVQYMTTDAYSGKSEGRSRITHAIAGLLLALIAWIILYTINPQLLLLELSIPNDSADSTTST